jgi:hypothetical protein
LGPAGVLELEGVVGESADGERCEEKEPLLDHRSTIT